MIRARTTFAASLVLVALLAFVFWDLSTRGGREEKAAGSKKILASDGKLVESIELGAGEGRGRPTVRFECREAGGGCSLASNTKWEITAPENTDADSLQIGSFLAALGAVNYEERIPLEPPLTARDWKSEFGLKSPLVTVAIRFRGEAEPVRLEFGAAAMIGTSHYALSSREPGAVLAVPAYLVKAVDRDFFHWRGKQLFPGIELDAVTEASWTHSLVVGKFRVERQGEDWGVTSPQKARADFMAANGIVSGLVTLNARAIADPRVKLAAKPFASAEFRTKDGGRHRLEVFPAADKTRFIARASARDWLAEIPAEDVTRFARTFPELRDTQLLSRTDKERAVRAELEYFARGAAGGRDPLKLALRREGSAWQPAPGTDPQYRADRLANLVAQFSAPEVRAHLPAEGKAYAAWKTGYHLVARFFDEAGKPLREFRVFVEDKDVAYADGEKPGEIRRLGTLFARAILELKSETPALAPPEAGGHGGHDHAH